MKCIARIITDSKNTETLDGVCISNEFDGDSSLPTLIVGKKKAESIFGAANVHMIDSRISDNVRWIPSKLESRSRYEKGLEKFNSDVMHEVVKDVSFYPVNIHTERLSNLKNLVSFLKSYDEKYTYITDAGVYVYNPRKNCVYGLSFENLCYNGMDRGRLVKWLYSNRRNRICTSTSFIKYNTKKYIDGNTKIIPYIYFLHEQ